MDLFSSDDFVSQSQWDTSLGANDFDFGAFPSPNALARTNSTSSFRSACGFDELPMIKAEPSEIDAAPAASHPESYASDIKTEPTNEHAGQEAILPVHEMIPQFGESILLPIQRAENVRTKTSPRKSSKATTSSKADSDAAAELPAMIRDVVAEVEEQPSAGNKRSRAIRTAAGVKTKLEEAPEGLNAQEQQLWYKRQRRLIKNRESAHLSRQRKKQHVDELQDQVNGLIAERDAWKQKCAQLEKQVTMLLKQSKA